MEKSNLIVLRSLVLWSCLIFSLCAGLSGQQTRAKRFNLSTIDAWLPAVGINFMNSYITVSNTFSDFKSGEYVFTEGNYSTENEVHELADITESNENNMPSGGTCYSKVDPPETPVQQYPANSAVCLPTSFGVDWSDVDNAELYVLMLDNNSDFSSLEFWVGETYSGHWVFDLEPYTKYYWKVSAENSAGASPYSSVWSFTTGPEVPSSPVPSSPANGATCQSTTITLDWNSVAGASTYNLEVDDLNGFSSPIVNLTGLTTSSHQVTGLSSGVKYYWRVEAANSCGNTSYWSATRNFTTAGIIPSTPSLASPLNNAICRPVNPTLSWNSVSGATSYDVKVDNHESFISPDEELNNITGTSASISGLNTGTTYYWKVRAKNSCDEYSSWSGIRSFSTIDPEPGIPAPTSPSDGETCQPLEVTFEWNEGSWAAAYHLEVDDDHHFLSPVYDQSVIASTSQEVSGLTIGSTYYWRVQSVNNCGYESSWSSIRNFETLNSSIDAPTLVSPADAAGDRPINLTLVWEEIADATDYRIEVDNNNDFSSPLYDEVINGTSTEADGLSGVTVYYWRVRANGDCSSSSWSDVWQFTTGNITGIENLTNTSYSLGQNYPNPFIEATTIEFNLPVANTVYIEISDLQGKLIESFSGDYTAGKHTLEIDLRGKAESGVYLYRMTTDDFTDTKLFTFR